MGGGTAQANKLHRTAIGAGDSGRELIAMIGGKQMKPDADLSEIIGALGHRCAGGATVVRRYRE